MGQDIKEDSMDKKEKRKEIIWKIIPIALYFIFLCCLLFSFVSTPIFILVVLIVVGIMVALNIFCWKKYGKQKSEDNELTIDRIMDCVRKEGYYPEKASDEKVVFKIQGNTYCIAYRDSYRLSIYITFLIQSDDIQLFKEISWDVIQAYFLQRMEITNNEDKTYIVLVINSFVKSYSDFRGFLPTYISSLIDAEGMIRELYNQRKSDKQRPTQSTIRS